MTKILSEIDSIFKRITSAKKLSNTYIGQSQSKLFRYKKPKNHENMLPLWGQDISKFVFFSCPLLFPSGEDEMWA